MAWLNSILLKSSTARGKVENLAGSTRIWLSSFRLKSSNPEVRCKAIQNLAGSTNTRDTERIFASLYDENPQVRCAAVRALEKQDSPDTVQSLVGALKDANYQVREAAARVLGRVGRGASTEPLAAALKDSDSAVRVAAAGALRALGWKPSTRDELARFEIALGKTPAAVSAGKNSPALLDGEFSHDTSFQRREAADAWKEMNDPRKTAPLLASLSDSDPGNRISAIHSLASVIGEEVTNAILKLLRDRDPDVRLAAAEALAGRDDSPPAHFLGLLEDTNFEVRLAAVQFLGRIRHQQIAEVLLPLLADATVDVRQATATALGLIGDASAIESLVVSLTDEDRQVRHAAESALERIDANWIFSDAAQQANGRLEALLSVRSPWERLAIQQVIEKLRGPTAAAAHALPQPEQSEHAAPVD